MKTKEELFGIEIKRYLKASKQEKGKILDSLERQTGMWRESIIRCFKRKQLDSVYKVKPKRGRKVYYTKDVDEALKEIWEDENWCCGELLHEAVSENVRVYRRDKCWRHNDETTGKLLAMSFATVKRKVTGWKCDTRHRGISSTSPSVIKDRIPLFEGSWYDVMPGMGQIDTVAHCGGSLAGDFMFSLGYVDVSSGWFEYTMQWNKGMESTKNSLEYVRSTLPMELTHIHPDCGKEFLNQIVLAWAEEKKIKVSRSRSYHKNDNGYIERETDTLLGGGLAMIVLRILNCYRKPKSFTKRFACIIIISYLSDYASEQKLYRTENKPKCTRKKESLPTIDC
jgi:hypothetical protein